MVMTYVTSLSGFLLRRFYFGMHFLSSKPYKGPRIRDRVSQLLFTRRDDAALLTRCYSGRPLSKCLCSGYHQAPFYPPDCQ